MPEGENVAKALERLRKENAEMRAALEQIASVEDDCQGTIPAMNWLEMQRLARRTLAKPADVVKCPTCAGTGEVHSHNP